MKRVFGLRPAALALCALVGVLVGAGGYTVYYAEATSYLSDDPRACVNCHIMRPHYDGWQKASHHAVATCNDCHVPQGFFARYWAKAVNGYRHSKAFTLQDFHEPIRIHDDNSRTLNANCQRCHAELVSEVTAHVAGQLGGLDCVRCHTSVGHGPTR
jgi:cytochrome c nitrite reductase small subunit